MSYLVECPAIARLNSLGSDFRSHHMFVLLKDGREIEVPYRYDIINSEEIQYFANITGLDTDKIQGLFWKDKDGCIRSYA
ncbi:MAG: hypothetical protein ACRDFB_09465 [Rhabdochlamydiaceae bacterium]